MKYVKNLLAVLMAVCLLAGLCTVAMADMDLVAKPSIILSQGDNLLILSNANTIAVMDFIPGESGIFRFSIVGTGTLYEVYGSMASGFFYHYEAVANNVLEVEIKESVKDSPMLIGVAAGSKVTLKIERVGDASFDINALPYETYQHTENLTKFTLPADITKLTYMDITTPHTAVKGTDGYYHLDNVDGPVLYFDFANAPYVSIAAAATNGNVKDILYDEHGNFVKKIEFITCINTYNGYIDNSTNRPVAGYTDKGIYPLTDDLVYIMQTHTPSYGWNDETSPNYLFTDKVIDKDTAWMFPVCYDAEQLLGGKKNPYKVYSDSQITLGAEESAYFTVYNKDGLNVTVAGAAGFTVNDATDTNGEYTTQVSGNEVTFLLKNTSAAQKTYQIGFGAPIGAPENPEMLPQGGNYTATPDGADGYTYNYLVTDDGYITVTVNGGTASVNGGAASAGPIKLDVVSGDAVTITIYGNGDVDWTLDVHAHAWADASCLTPATCACGATKGEPAPHDYATGEGICPGVNLAEGEECGSDIRIFLSEEENTLTVPAGETNYYFGYFNGMNATLTGNNVTIFHNGQSYVVSDSVTFPAVSSNPRNPSIFVVTNTGTADAQYSLNFKFADGSFMAPELLTQSGDYAASIGAGATDGYYYSFVATDDCTVTVTINTADGWQYCLMGSAGQGEGMHWSDDDPVVPSESVELATGDVLTIIVATYNPADMFNYPVASIDWTLDVHIHNWSEATCAADSTCDGCDVTKPALPHNYENGLCVSCGDDIRIRLLETENKITVPAGQTNYYIGFYDGMNTTLTGNNVTIIHDGQTYVVDGSVTFMAVGDVKNPSLFVVTNTGEEDATYQLNMVYPLGSKGNPEIMDKEGSYSVTFEEGDEAYSFSYTAPADGTVTVTVQGENGWQYSVSNPDGYYYGDIHTSGDDPVVNAESVTVKKGQVLEIMVGTYNPENPQTMPAGTASVTVSFEEGPVNDGGNPGGTPGDGSNPDDGNKPNDPSFVPILGVDLDGDGESDMIIEDDMLISTDNGVGIDLNGDGVVDAMMLDLDKNGIYDGLDLDYDGVADLIVYLLNAPEDNGGQNGGSNNSPQTGDTSVVLPWMLAVLATALCVVLRKKQAA